MLAIPDLPTDVFVRLSRIQRRSSTASLTPQAEVSPPISRPPRASGPLSPSDDMLPADTALGQGEQ